MRQQTTARATIEVAETVRHTPTMRELPILAVMTLAHPSDAARILRAGCDAYLSKPVHVEDVREAASQLLRGGRQRAALHAFSDAPQRHRERGRFLQD